MENVQGTYRTKLGWRIVFGVVGCFNLFLYTSVWFMTYEEYNTHDLVPYLLLFIAASPFLIVGIRSLEEAFYSQISIKCNNIYKRDLLSKKRIAFDEITGFSKKKDCAIIFSASRQIKVPDSIESFDKIYQWLSQKFNQLDK